MQPLHHRDGHCPLDVSELQCDVVGSQAGQLPTVRCEQAAGRGRQVLDVDAHPRCLVQRGHRHLSTSVRRPRCLLPATVGAMQHQLNLRGAPGLQTLEHAARTAAGSSGWFRCWRRPCLHSDERHSSASVRPPLGPVHVGCWRAGASGATTAADGREVTHLAAVAAGLTGGPAVTSITVGVASAADALLLSRPVPPRTAAASPELPRSRVEAGGWMRRGGGGGGGDGAANSTGIVGSYSSSGLGSCGSSGLGSCGSSGLGSCGSSGLGSCGSSGLGSCGSSGLSGCGSSGLGGCGSSGLGSCGSSGLSGCGSSGLGSCGSSGLGSCGSSGLGSCDSSGLGSCGSSGLGSCGSSGLGSCGSSGLGSCGSSGLGSCGSSGLSGCGSSGLSGCGSSGLGGCGSSGLGGCGSSGLGGCGSSGLGGCGSSGLGGCGSSGARRRLRQRWVAWSGHAPPGPQDVPRGAGLGAGLPGIAPAAGR